jgi:hypothetical protein
MERPKCAIAILCLSLVAAGAAAGQGTGSAAPPDTGAPQAIAAADKSQPAAEQPAPAPPPATAWSLGPFAVSGLVDGYYSLGFNHPASNVNGLRNFDDRANQPELNLAKVTLDYSPKPVGVHVDLGFGRALDIISTGEKDVTQMRWLEQAYVSVKPASWKGLELDFGRFVTSAGAEVIETPSNFNYSRSLLFSWLIPYNHFGMRASMPVTKQLTAGVQWVAGWNNIVTNSTYRTFGFTGSWTPSSKVTWINTYYVGPDENKADRGFRNDYDTVLIVNATSKASLYVNFDYLHDSPKLGPAWKAYGIAGAAKFQVSKKLAISPRLEWMNDVTGSDTGIAQKVKEVTVTGTYSLMDRLSAWLEFRNDWSDQPFFNRGNEPGTFKHQPTVLLGLVAVIGPKR